MRGRLGSSRMESAASAAAATAAVPRRNLRLVVRLKGKRNYSGRTDSVSMRSSRITELANSAHVEESEAKRNLHVDAAVRGRIRKRPTLKRIRLIKQSRTQNATRVGKIHLVENVSRVNAESEVVTMIRAAGHSRRAAAEKRAPRPAAAAATARSAPTAPRAAAVPLAACTAADFRAEAKSLGQPQIQDDMGWAGGVINRDNFFARNRGLGRISVECSKRRAINVCGAATGSGSERWAIVEHRIVVEIVGSGDVERR